MACGNTWPVEDPLFYCSCGQVHKTTYSDSATVVQSDYGILGSNRKQAYVATCTQVAAVGQRHYHNIRVK